MAAHLIRFLEGIVLLALISPKAQPWYPAVIMHVCVYLETHLG